MANSDDPFKEGYLCFPPHGVLSQLKKSWQKRYCRLFRWSKHGIDRLEVFGSIEDQKSSTIASIIPLESCVKITQDIQKHQPNVFAVWTKTSVHHFSANSEKEMNDWICALQAVAFSDNVSRHTTIEEDNDLYCSAGDAGIFNVKLIPSDASERCGLKEQWYTLVVAPTALELQESYDTGTVLLSWPYQFIRKYGYKADRLFTFEAGRKCDSGEGAFYLEHSNQQEIFRCMSSKMKSIKKILSGDPVMSSMMCSDNQVRHWHMMARSRSPLPLSSNSIFDNDLSMVKPPMLLPSPLPQSSVSQSPPPPPPRMPKTKTVPTKKPSIYVNEFPWETKELDSPTSPDYDPVLVVTEAWKSKGRDDTDYNTNHYAVNPVIPNNSDYDHLQHFRPISKRCNGYRIVQPLSLTTKPTAPNSREDNAIMPARKADDSHYGYGTINRKSTEKSHSNNKVSSSLAHSELQYAVVLKSNKV